MAVMSDKQFASEVAVEVDEKGIWLVIAAPDKERRRFFPGAGASDYFTPAQAQALVLKLRAAILIGRRLRRAAKKAA